MKSPKFQIPPFPFEWGLEIYLDGEKPNEKGV
jgi:hypothetical protein